MARAPQRLTLSTLGVVIPLLVVPPVGEAATTFGSRLEHAPGGGHCLIATAPCTHVAFSHPGGPTGEQVAQGSPVSGVITKFRIRAARTGAGPATVTFRLANIAQASREAAVATAVGPAGPTVTVAGTGSVEEFPARLPVGTGSHLAMDTTNVDAVSTAISSGVGYLFAPPLRRGAGLRPSSAATGDLLLQATVEPDADHDGFGDQTQDRVKPRLTKLAVRQGQAAFSLTEKAQVSLRLTGHKTMRVSARRGANRVRFATTLRRGRYRLAVAATDTAGNRSNPLVKRFSVR